MEKPKLIYKYARLNNNTKSALKESYLWFCPAKDLNDPFDLKYRFSQRFMHETLKKAAKDFGHDLETEIKKQGKTTDISAIQLFANNLIGNEKFLESTMQFLRQHIYYSVCCFTENNDDILMWSHYAENHTGICLIYDMSETDFWTVFNPVRYSEEYPVCDTFDEVNTKGIFTKSIHWNYEREWRIVSLAESGQKAISRKSLKGIIFGCKTDPKKAKEIISICNNSGYGKLDYYAMKPSFTEYKLVMVKIPVPI